MAIPVTSDILSMLHNPKIRRFFGVVTLCVAAIATLLALGFVGVSFATDNWKHISVNRNKLAQIVKEQNNTKLDDEFAQDYRYFDRVEGIFRVCFPMAEKPARINDDIYLSPVVQEWCSNIDYEMILNHGFLPDKLTSNGKVWINLARATIASFIVYFALMGVACVVGLAGCWSMSSGKLRATSVLTAFAFIFATSGMGLFHATNFYERNMVSANEISQYFAILQFLQFILRTLSNHVVTQNLDNIGLKLTKALPLMIVYIYFKTNMAKGGARNFILWVQFFFCFANVLLLFKVVGLSANLMHQ